MLILVPSVLLAGSWPPWQWMWLIAFAIYGVCKGATCLQSEIRGQTLFRQIAYVIAWPGLNPDRFLGCAKTLPPNGTEWSFAFSKVALGLIILWTPIPHLSDIHDYARGWIGLIGLAFLLHFGLFHLLSCVWRAWGFEAQPLMDWPIASISLSEFWGRRWNTAFHDLTYGFLFRPLTPYLGPKGALLAGFIASGIIHEIAISLPASGGYGGPTEFFFLQSLGILLERSRIGLWLGLAHGIRGWLFTATAVIVPAPLLFHPPFITRVIVPFLQALGAWQ